MLQMMAAMAIDSPRYKPPALRLVAGECIGRVDPQASAGRFAEGKNEEVM